MLHTIGTFAGGLGLLLLAIELMTEGLRNASGPIVRKVLAHWTRTPLHGIATGIAMTTLVQSSSAISVAVIGFVNAGMLTLSQALGVIYGANVGTTFTGWLVVLVGFEFDIEALALPMIGAGVFMEIIGRRNHISAIGKAIAGFGLFFIGIDFMKDAFEYLIESHTIQPLVKSDFFSIVSMIVAGFVLTVLTQSSSAAMAIILTATVGGALSITAGAAMVIGANLGTTTTAVLSVLDAAPNARRTAAGHVIFNLITGTIALFILPLMLYLVMVFEDIIGLDSSPAITLALFHTTFNILGVLIMLPLTGQLSHKLMNHFKTREEDQSRPQFLDKSILSAPAMAITALMKELDRMLEISGNAAATALLDGTKAASRIASDQRSINNLSSQLNKFIGALRQMSMAEDVSNTLPFVLRIDRYIRETSRLTRYAIDAREIANQLKENIIYERINDHMRNCAAIIHAAIAGQAKKQVLTELEDDYHNVKDQLLNHVARNDTDPQLISALLDDLSHIHRMTIQAIKARRYLKTLNKRLHKKQNSQKT